MIKGRKIKKYLFVSPSVRCIAVPKFSGESADVTNDLIISDIQLCSFVYDQGDQKI